MTNGLAVANMFFTRGDGAWVLAIAVAAVTAMASAMNVVRIILFRLPSFEFRS